MRFVIGFLLLLVGLTIFGTLLVQGNSAGALKIGGGTALVGLIILVGSLIGYVRKEFRRSGGFFSL